MGLCSLYVTTQNKGADGSAVVGLTEFRFMRIRNNWEGYVQSNQLQSTRELGGGSKADIVKYMIEDVIHTVRLLRSNKHQHLCSDRFFEATVTAVTEAANPQVSVGLPSSVGRRVVYFSDIWDHPDLRLNLLVYPRDFLVYKWKRH